LKAGIAYKDFWHMTPKAVQTYINAYEDKRKEDVQIQEYISWLNGIHVAEAISCTFGKGKYPKSPFLKKDEEKETNKNKETNEEVAVFEMKQRINTLRKQGLPESPI